MDLNLTVVLNKRCLLIQKYLTEESPTGFPYSMKHFAMEKFVNMSHDCMCTHVHAYVSLYKANNVNLFSFVSIKFNNQERVNNKMICINQCANYLNIHI